MIFVVLIFIGVELFLWFSAYQSARCEATYKRALRFFFFGLFRAALQNIGIIFDT